MTTKITKPETKAAKKPAAPAKAVAPKVAAESEAAPKVAAPKDAVVVKSKITATVTVKQTGSPLRRPKNQRLHLLSLGLGKMNRVKTLPDSPSVRGLIDKVKHMVTVLS